MATKLTTLAVNALIALVYWKKSKNLRSETDYGTAKEMDETRNTLALREWVDRYSIPVTPISEEEKAECLAERTQLWESLKRANTPQAATERQVFEQLYVKGTKLIEPEYSANAGFRRGSVLFSAMVQRFGMKDADGNPLPISGLIPVIVKTYKSEADRVFDQQLENALQGVGNKNMSDFDKLRVVKVLFDEGQREIRARELYPTTTAQKLYNLCQVDCNYPALRILRRVQLPPDAADHIKLGSVRHDDLIRFNNRFDAQIKRSKGKPLTEKERTMEPITEDEVANYFADLKAGAKNDAKIMNKKDIEQGSKSNAVLLFRKAFESVVDNNTNSLLPYIAHAEALNLHVALIDGGKAHHAEMALRLVEKDSAFVKMLAEAVNDGKLADIAAAVNLIRNPPAPVRSVAPTPAPAPAKKP